jgi:hypothetical protein
VKIDKNSGLLVSSDFGFERIELLDEKLVGHILEENKIVKISPETFINKYNEVKDKINSELIKF